MCFATLPHCYSAGSAGARLLAQAHNTHTWRIFWSVQLASVRTGHLGTADLGRFLRRYSCQQHTRLSCSEDVCGEVSLRFFASGNRIREVGARELSQARAAFDE